MSAAKLTFKNDLKGKFVTSRKISRSIEEGIDLLCDGKFIERDVKLLLIDLREAAKYLREQFRSTENDVGREFIKTLEEFIEICDFIAHASRHRGLVEEKVRAHVQYLRQTLDEPPADSLESINVIPFNASRVVEAIILVSDSALGRVNIHRSKNRYAALRKHQSDIELCLLSLMQDNQIMLKDDAGYCVLQLQPWEGQYRLYGRVMTAKVQDQIGTKKMVVLRFPVMVSTATCNEPIILGCNFDSVSFPVFETFRDGKLGLQVRVLDMAEESQPSAADYRYKWDVAP